MAQEVRSGPVTGATIVLLLERHGPMSPSLIARKLGMEYSYVSRVCRTLAAAGILSAVQRPVAGTPPLRVYATPEKVPDEWEK